MPIINQLIAEKLYDPIDEVQRTPSNVYLLKRVGIVLSGQATTSQVTVQNPISGTIISVKSGDVFVVPVTVSGVNNDLYNYWEFFETSNDSTGNVITFNLTAESVLPVAPVAGAVVDKVERGIRTNGGVNLTISPQAGELRSDQSGIAPIDTILDGITASVELPQTSIVVKTYEVAFPMYNVAENAFVVGDVGIGSSLARGNIRCKLQADILLIPKGSKPGKTIGQIMLYNIGMQQADLSLNFQVDQQLTANVTFTSYGEPPNTSGLPTKKLSNHVELALRQGTRYSLHTRPFESGLTCAGITP